MTLGLKFTTDRKVTYGNWEDSLDPIKQELEGWLEELVFPSPDPGLLQVAYFDEEGLLKSLPVNHAASRYIAAFREENIYIPLVGPVMVFGLKDGEPTDLPNEAADIALKIVRGM